MPGGLEHVCPPVHEAIGSFILLFFWHGYYTYNGRVGPAEPVFIRRFLMTMTGSWHRWFVVGLIACTIAVGAPLYGSAQQPTPSPSTSPTTDQPASQAISPATEQPTLPSLLPA